MATFATQTRSNSTEQQASYAQSQKSESQKPFGSNPFNKSPFNKGAEGADDEKKSKQIPVEDGVSQLSSFFKGTGTPVAQTKLKVAQPKNKAEGDVVQKMPEAEAQAKNETGMPSALRSGLESLSGADLSGVRVHRNSSKPEAIDAHAYTQGQYIHLAPGQEKHLPHEGWHVVQQMQGRVQPTIQKKSMLINDDDGLEKEADVMGDKALQMKSKGSPSEVKNTEASTSTINTANTGVVQRAMKFEYQLKDNYLVTDNGDKVKELPRKFGPRDYIVRFPSGGTMETETGGQIEFETTWEKEWSKLNKQISDMQAASLMMHNSPNVTGSDRKTYKEFPFGAALKHLRPDAGFPKSGANWSRSQKDGEAEVHNPSDTKENFRSSTSFASDKNILKTISNGKKVFVYYYSSDGKWARIEYKGTYGWIWSQSLKGIETKYFEDRTDEKLRPDKPLQTGEKLLVVEGDPSWAPYVQISESFELEQYESYLRQYDKTLGPGLIENTNKYLSEQNSEKATDGESEFKKLARDYKFLVEHNKLRNLLMIICHYIKKGTNQEKGDGDGAAKYTFSLMNRTHFGSIFNSMSKKEQALFTEMVKDLKNGVIPTLGLTTTTKMFKYGTKPGYNPTIYNWLLSITKGGDILSIHSGNKLPAAMGKYKLDEEKGKQKGLVRFEARNERDNFPELGKWDDHALRHFKAAMDKRPRETGKDKTGLEL